MVKGRERERDAAWEEEKRERREGCEPRRNVGFRFDISARGGHESPESRSGRLASGWDPLLRASLQDSRPIRESFPSPYRSFTRSLARFPALCLTTTSPKAKLVKVIGVGWFHVSLSRCCAARKWQSLFCWGRKATKGKGCKEVEIKCERMQRRK